MGAVTIRKVLVANRGEIAVRVIRTLRAMGLASVAVHSDADAGALHVQEADEAVRIGPAEPGASYLSISAIVEAARRTGAGAVHPGYGFLSERFELARALEEAGIAFVGPPAAVLEGTRDKLGVKARVAAAGVPVIPGPPGAIADGAAALREAARATGFPMLLKAVSGGGGKGMRRVAAEPELAEAAASARREAGGAFGDARLYAEALIEPARHVEAQVLADARGEVRVLGTRDCSVQRRHQKLIEEAPAPGLAPETRATVERAAADAARALGYRNAGTVEFLVDPRGRAFFLEVNRRLQVEHPVTEACLGIDLVAWQLRIAMGEPLPPEGAWVARGHAVEARVCAEDPDNGFLPSAGEIVAWREPRGPGLRVDAGFGAGSTVPPFYDSLLMKVIAHGETRDEAIRRLDAALAETGVLGVRTNVGYLRQVLQSADFRAGRLSIGAPEPVPARVPVEVVLAAAAAESAPAAKAAGGRARTDPWREIQGFRPS
jgi:acetyl-CoA/propionyl-CoA carboxylase biotin carboxyl carrier protein